MQLLLFHLKPPFAFHAPIYRTTGFDERWLEMVGLDEYSNFR
jgi:hypothetical protein